MSPTTGLPRGEWWHAAPKARRPAHRFCALLRTLRRWWARERYRPERRYMRG